MASQEPVERPEERLSTYRGRPQPPVNERLQQIYNFLADEDYYRCLGFKQKFNDIKDYLNDLATGDQVFVHCDDDLLDKILDQVKIHECWIDEATKISPFEFNSSAIKHHNRFGLRGWKPSAGLINYELEDLATYQTDTPMPEAKLHVTLQEDTGRKPPKEPDPFEYTRKVAEYRDSQDVGAQVIRERYNRIDALAFNPLPRNFKGPWVPPSAETLLKKWEQELAKLTNLSKNLLVVYKRAPRPTLERVVHMLKTIFKQDTPADTLLLASDFTPAELKKLILLTNRSTHPTKPSHLRGEYLTFVARVNGIIRSTDTWPEDVEEPVRVEDLLDMVTSKGPINLDHDAMMWTLQLMHDDGNLRYNKDADVVKAPHPTQHPEYKAGQWSSGFPPTTLDEWAYMGMRLANAVVKLTTQVGMAYADKGYMKRMVIEYTNNLAKRLRAWEKHVDGGKGTPSLIEMATPLVKEAHREGLTEAVAVKILQEKIVEESNRNWETRASPTTIWDWTRGRTPVTEKYFSIDRWTPTIQHIGDVHKEDMYWEWAKKQMPVAPQTRRPFKRRKFIKGEPSLPLGETVMQADAISNKFDEHLHGLDRKEFHGIYGPEGTYTLKQKAIRDAKAKVDAGMQTEGAGGIGTGPRTGDGGADLTGHGGTGQLTGDGATDLTGGKGKGPGEGSGDGGTDNI